MRKRIRRITVMGMIGMASMALMGCAQPPTEQLEAAQQAVEAARTAGATEYAREDLMKLEDELALAKEELASQEKSLSFLRSYTKADKMLTHAAEVGKEVETKATEKKEAAKAEAIAAEQEAKNIVASVQDLIAKVPVGKDRAAVESLKQDLGRLQSSLGLIHQLIEKGDYMGAEALAKALKDKGAMVSAQVQKVIDKAKSGKTREGDAYLSFLTLGQPLWARLSPLTRSSI